MKLKDAKILVTGGSSGIGKATAKILVEAGAKVLITGRDEEKLKAVASELNISFVQADVATEEGITKTFQIVESHWGGLDVLVNNAGIGGGFSTLETVSAEEFQKVFAVNVVGAALMTQKAAELFKAQGKGHIVNIASTAATKGFARGTVYAASKFALRGMTECWQAELRKHNIRVILVNPSEVPTAFGQESREERPEEHNKLTSFDIAHTIKSALEMDDRGFIKEVTVIATNPF